jgi:hypothetical protein
MPLTTTTLLNWHFLSGVSAICPSCWLGESQEDPELRSVLEIAHEGPPSNRSPPGHHNRQYSPTNGNALPASSPASEPRPPTADRRT